MVRKFNRNIGMSWANSCDGDHLADSRDSDGVYRRADGGPPGIFGEANMAKRDSTRLSQGDYDYARDCGKINQAEEATKQAMWQKTFPKQPFFVVVHGFPAP